MLKKLIIITYLAYSRGSAEFDQLAGFDLTATSAEQHLHFDLTPTTTADFSDTVVKKSFPSSDNVVEIFPLSDSTVKNAPSSDTIVGDFIPTNDTTVEMFPPNESTFKNALSNMTIVEDYFPNNDTAIEIFPTSDSTVKNAPSSDTIIGYSFPTNDIDDQVVPINDLTLKNTPSSDTTVEYPYPTDEAAVENSPSTDLNNAPSIDTIIKKFPSTSYTAVEDSPLTLDTVLENATSGEIPDFVSHIEWGKVSANLEPFLYNDPCVGKDCPNNSKTTYKPLDLKYILTRSPRSQSNVYHDIQQPDCPIERIRHIGSFVVPSQLDIVKTMRTLLQNTFVDYRTKTISFLEDIDKASRTMIDEYENKCYNKTEYQECVERVSSGTKMITSNVLNTIHSSMHDIENLYENLKCNVTNPAAIDDPMKLIKLLASELATIDFAMPGFLRLLYTCFRFCASHSGDITSIATHPNPNNLKKVIQPQLYPHSVYNFDIKDSRLLHFSSRPHYKKLGRMISLNGKPAGGLKYLNSDRISYLKKD